MSTSSVIGSMQSALNCAAKCDCCDKLQAQINAINARFLSLKGVDENALKNSLKLSLAPDINTAIVGGIAVVTTKLQPQIDTALKNSTNAFLEIVENTKKQRLLEIEQRGASEAATRAERNAAEYARQMRETQAEVTRITGEQARANRVNKDFEIESNKLRELEQRNTREAERLANIERKNAAKFNALEEATTAARREAELARGLSNQAATRSGQAVLESANAANQALNASNDVSGLKSLVNGLKGRVGALGEAISKLESAVGGAVVSAAKAIGISEAALASTGRILGKIADIFNIIGTFAVLFEQLATLNVLGGRIDGVENAIVALGNDVSRMLGKLLGLQNRIAANTASISEVRVIAVDAKGIGEAASQNANAAQVTATRAENFAQIANANAKTAQTTADSAVRNASLANENATTAYQRAGEAQVRAGKAQTTATNAEGIGGQAKKIAGEALGKAGQAIGLGLTAVALFQTVRFLRGLPGLPGRNGTNGTNGRNGTNGAPGVTTVVQVPGQQGAPGRDGRPGINGINRRNGIDVNPAEAASLRALIIQQHTQTRASAGSAIAGLKGFIGAGFAAITALTTAIGSSVIFTTALNVLTFAATVHNGLMLSNNLGQTLGTIIDQVLGFVLPKGLDGTPISISTVLGKAVHEIIADTVGEANYAKISEDWAKANRIYQASVNVFNQIGNAVGLVTAGMEIIGGNVAKIGNGLKVWGVLGEKVYSWMNPQPNFKGKFFNFINTATAEANTIAMMVAIPIGISAAAIEINSSVGAVKKELDQKDPVDKDGHPILDSLGNAVKYQPGITVPDPEVTTAAQLQAKADSTNIIAATLEDIFDGGD